MDEDKKQVHVAENLCGQRLDVGLLKAGLVISRSQGQRLVEQRKVFVNSQNEKVSYRLQLGDLIEVNLPVQRKITLVPYDFPLDIVFEDEFVIVVNKPAGLVVHPACGHENDTLINALLARKVKLSHSHHFFRPGLVHRIDKGTSGLLVLAKTEEAHNHLARQFFKRSVCRSYLALCFSHQKLDKGVIESHIARDPKNRQRFKINRESKGKRAVTHYWKRAESGVFALYELKLETGRSHQIRVHLSSNGNPIVGDELYNGKNQVKNLKSQKLKEFILEMDRFALHAETLGFSHPTTQKNMMFKASIPSDLKPLFEMAGFF